MRSAQDIVTAFESCTLPLPEWNHQAHVTVTIAYLLKHGSTEKVLPLLRESIQRFNATNGIKQTLTGGYHETMTRFWLWAVDRFLASADETAGVAELAKQFVTQTDRHLNREYYSRDRFMSWEARLGWVEPDLKPLERPRRVRPADRSDVVRMADPA
jgi:hypothetical protein